MEQCRAWVNIRSSKGRQRRSGPATLLVRTVVVLASLVLVLFFNKLEGRVERAVEMILDSDRNSTKQFR
jgi:hypothetical protein